MDEREKRFDKLVSEIKSVKIQGATSVALNGLKAYFLKPRKSTINLFVKLRPTEPMLFNALKKASKKSLSVEGFEEYLKHSQNRINKFVFRLIKNNSVIYTHCHSSSVIQSLIYAKRNGKKFRVFNTETRPLYQGRKTASELSSAGIKVTNFIDSGMDDAITDCDIIFIGADAILKKGVINKIGSEAIGEIASIKKKPLYIVSQSWKFSGRNIKIESRKQSEVWNEKSKNIEVRNSAFEKLPKKYIKAVISELGIFGYSEFIKNAKKALR